MEEQAMSMIDYLEAREVLDNRMNPTIEVDCYLEDGSFGRAIAPKVTDISKALKLVNEQIDSNLEGMDSLDQIAIDKALLNSKTKTDNGTTMAVSMAVARAASDFLGISLREHLGSFHANKLPHPVFDSKVPVNAQTFTEALALIRQNKDLKEAKTDKKALNPSLFKTISEIYEQADKVKRSGAKVVVDATDNLTQDGFIADLCLVLEADEVLLNNQSIAVINQFVRIEEELDDSAQISL